MDVKHRFAAIGIAITDGKDGFIATDTVSGAFSFAIPAPAAVRLAERICEADHEKAAHFYRAALLRQSPQWVPKSVRVLHEQFGDGPYRGAGVAAGVQECTCNLWGAVSVVARDGKPLGLRPAEFEVVSWQPNAARTR